MDLQGFIRNTSSRNGKGKKPPYRPWTSYNAEIHADDGNVTKISFGFDKPEVSEGDYVSLQAFDKNGFLEVDQSTIERLDPPKQAAQPPQQDGTSGNGVIAATAPAGGDAFATKEYGYRTHPEDARRITYSSAQDRALKVVSILLANDALPHSKAKGKGGEAQRYQELMAAVDKITVKLYHDALTLRVIENVADEGIIDTSPQSNLPDDDAPAKPATNPLDD